MQLVTLLIMVNYTKSKNKDGKGGINNQIPNKTLRKGNQKRFYN